MKIYMLLDRSGSMAGTLWAEAIGSINGYVEALDSKSTKIRVTAFDSVSRDVIRDTTVKDWVNIKADESFARGTTPLFDSVAEMVDQALENNDPKTVLVIITDGAENASQEYKTTAAIQAKLNTIKAKEWPTIFLGANFANIDQHTSTFGVSSANSMSVTTSNMRGFTTSLGAKTNSYDASGFADTMSYSEAEKATFAQD